MIYHDTQTLNQEIRLYLDFYHNTPFLNRPESKQELFDIAKEEVLNPMSAERYELKEYRSAAVPKTSQNFLHRPKL